MTEEQLLTVNIEIPFASNRIAEIAYHVLRVDAEPRKTVVKEVAHKENCLVVKFQGTSSRQLRVGVNSLFENVSLISQTLENFGDNIILGVFAFIIYPSMGLIMTPNWSDLRTIKDEHSENNRKMIARKQSLRNMTPKNMRIKKYQN
ncbi:hypothetical protein Trydic_g14955 [Trypoxylus dichotomus]